MLAIAGIGVAAASAYYWARKPRPSQPPFDLQHQTIVEVNNKTLKNTVRHSRLLLSLFKVQNFRFHRPEQEIDGP